MPLSKLYPKRHRPGSTQLGLLPRSLCWGCHIARYHSQCDSPAAQQPRQHAHTAVELPHLGPSCSARTPSTCSVLRQLAHHQGVHAGGCRYWRTLHQEINDSATHWQWQMRHLIRFLELPEVVPTAAPAHSAPCTQGAPSGSYRQGYQGYQRVHGAVTASAEAVVTKTSIFRCSMKKMGAVRDLGEPREGPKSPKK